MKNNTVKVLLYNDKFIDTYNLDKGIESTSIPSIYSKNTTMESLEHLFTRFCGKDSKVLENLRKCELKTFKLIEE